MPNCSAPGCKVNYTQKIAFQSLNFQKVHLDYDTLGYAYSIVMIYTIKTRLKYIYIYICVYIYMFICSELIEETGRPPGLIFGMWGYFWPGSDKFESWKFFHTFDGIMT